MSERKYFVRVMIVEGVLPVVVAGIVFACLTLLPVVSVMIPSVLAAVVALVLAVALTHLAKRRQTGQGDALVERIVGEIDHIMIGAAETSFFVDTIKNKLSHDVVAANGIVSGADQNAGTTEQIASNAERAPALLPKCARRVLLAVLRSDRYWSKLVKPVRMQKTPQF